MIKRNSFMIIIVILFALVIVYSSTRNDGTDGTSGQGLEPDEGASQGLFKNIQRAGNHSLAYVANSRSKSILVVDLDAIELLGSVYLGDEIEGGPRGMDITPDGKRLYVTGGETCHDVIVLDTTNFEIVDRINLGTRPILIKISSDGGEAFVFRGDGNPCVLVVDLETCEATDEIGLDAGIGHVRLSPDGDTLYVRSNRGVVFIDARTHEVIKEIEMVTEWATPFAVHPNGTMVYVAHIVNVHGHWPSVHVFDSGTGKRVDTIENVTKRAYPDGSIRYIEVSPDGDIIYVADSMGVLLTVVDASSNKVLLKRDDIYTSECYYGGPNKVYFSPDGGRAYLIYRGGIPIDSPGRDLPSAIFVVDTETHESIGVIGLGEWAGAGMMVVSP